MHLVALETLILDFVDFPRAPTVLKCGQREGKVPMRINVIEKHVTNTV